MNLCSFICRFDQHLPSFGLYQQERIRKLAQHKSKIHLLDPSLLLEGPRLINQPKKSIPTVKVSHHDKYSIHSLTWNLLGEKLTMVST